MNNASVCGSEEAVEMFCERCRKKNKDRSADGLCKDCVIYFCSKCLDDHSYHQPDHVLTDKNGMPKDVCLKVCHGHADEIIKFYCDSCDKFFCSMCKTKEHKTCKHVSHLPYLVIDLENKEEFKCFVKEIKDIVSEIGDLEYDMKRKNVLVESISTDIKSQMDKIRKRLNQMADTRIETITKDVEVTKEKDKKALAADATDSSVIKSEIDTLNSDVQKLLGESKRCELFIIMKESCIKRKSLESDLQNLREHGITELRFEEDENCNKLFEAASSFGKLVSEHTDTECDDARNGGRAFSQEEVEEIIADRDEKIRRLNKDAKDFETKFSAVQKENTRLKEFVDVNEVETRRLNENVKYYKDKYSALEEEIEELKKKLVDKKVETSRLNKEMRDSTAKYMALERNYNQALQAVRINDEEIRRLKREVNDPKEAKGRYPFFKR